MGLTVTEPVQLTLTCCVLQIVKVFEQILYAADEREAKEVSMAQILCNSKAVRRAVMLCLSWICIGHLLWTAWV